MYILIFTFDVITPWGSCGCDSVFFFRDKLTSDRRVRGRVSLPRQSGSRSAVEILLRFVTEVSPPPPKGFNLTSVRPRPSRRPAHAGNTADRRPISTVSYTYYYQGLQSDRAEDPQIFGVR